MGEIKFKAKSIGSNEYVYGSYVKVAMPYNKGLGFQSFILTGAWQTINGYEALERVRVVESTVEQISYLNKQLATGSVKRVDEIIKIPTLEQAIVCVDCNKDCKLCGKRIEHNGRLEIGSKQIRARLDLEKVEKEYCQYCTSYCAECDTTKDKSQYCTLYKEFAKELQDEGCIILEEVK